MDKNQKSPPKKIDQIKIDFGTSKLDEPKSSEVLQTTGKAKKDGRGTRTPLKAHARGSKRPYSTKQSYYTDHVKNPYEWGEEKQINIIS